MISIGNIMKIGEYIGIGNTISDRNYEMIVNKCKFENVKKVY